MTLKLSLSLKNKIKMKVVQCYNCKKEITVKSNSSTKNCLCEECKKMGIKTPSSIKRIENIKKTNLKKYGVVSTLQLQETKEKIKKTNLEKYGTEHHTQTNDYKEKQKLIFDNKTEEEKKNIIEKRKQTCIEKYGVEHHMKIDENVIKINKTLKEKYNVENIRHIEGVEEKRKQTCIEKYGVEHHMKNKDINKKVIEVKLKKYFEKYIKILNILNLELLDEFKNSNNLYKFKCKICGTIFEQNGEYIKKEYLGYKRCPKCYPSDSGISNKEKEILEFIKSLNLKTIENSKQIISPYELDIFIPEKNIAIEFNGLYWHSEMYINNPYHHITKLKLCNQKNIKLIQIFEDEWDNKKDIVEARLRQILNCNNFTRIHARKCEIKEIDTKIKNEFLDKYHIQGKDISGIRLGAFYNDELISVMTFSKGSPAKGSKVEEEVWELNRFCTNHNYHIPGIAGKLLLYFKKNYKWKKIFSYADLRWSEGNVYYKLGFNYLRNTPCNYWYVKRGIRYHRYTMRKKENESKEISERLLRLQEGYYRIWDCGNMKFLMENK